MPFYHLKLPVYYLPSNPTPNTLYLVKWARFQPGIRQPNYRVSLTRSTSLLFSFARSFRRLQPCKALTNSIGKRERCDVGECFEQKLSCDSSEEETFDEVIQLDGHSNSRRSFNHKDYKERERRRKIGEANRGRVPWNKGRKHSAETRERIKQQTREAMRNPKVRKKMTECPRAHSNETKKRIRSSLRRLWGERLNWKRSREKFLLSWAENIAEAARKGGSDQQELDWDSYDKIREEMALQQLQWAVAKAKAKEMAQRRAERAAKAKAEKMFILARKREDQDTKAKIREKIRRSRRSEEEKEELAIAQELKLKARLTKLHRNKSINGQLTRENHRAWEKFDMGLTNRAQIQQEVSLADQIRAAKNRRAKFVAREAVAVSSPLYQSSETHCDCA